MRFELRVDRTDAPYRFALAKSHFRQAGAIDNRAHEIAGAGMKDEVPPLRLRGIVDS